jgi:endonuclease/exonuclease/phosphatase family metal-dependent hydrolase
MGSSPPPSLSGIILPVRIASLNVGHQTWARPILPTVVAALLDLTPDVLILVEYVEGDGRPELRAALADAGLPHVATSPVVLRRPGSWWNQILIASRRPVEPSGSPDVPGRTQGLHSALMRVETGGLGLTGLRVPMRSSAATWYAMWETLVPAFEGDILIGDLNIDPVRSGKRDQVPLRLLREAGWRRYTAEGVWSYRSGSGHTSTVDHVFTRGDIAVLSARYVSEPFVTEGLTDHAALVVDVEAAR